MSSIDSAKLRGHLRTSISDIRRNYFRLGEGSEAVSLVVGHRNVTLRTVAPPHFVREYGENDRTISFIISRHHVIRSYKMATSKKMLRQLTIFGSHKVTYILKNPSSEYEHVVNKEWEENIIENLGLNKNEICTKAQVIYGTLKSKPEAISEYLHHKSEPKTLKQKRFRQSSEVNSQQFQQ